MEALISTINKLQDVFNAIGVPNTIDLPQIVVIGSQSSGKSSVLENIVGRDFLPRGTGIVTRRPLVLQLVHTPRKPEDKSPVEFGEFLHLPGQIFTDFNEIREEIIRDTDAKTGTSKGVSPIPINLKISSPHVLNLTLVDLPGMTKVPVNGQPADIEQQIRKMCLQYISRKNAIILAVTAANTDLANSDALNLAKQVDPTGERTIGVLTKIDIMDEGTHVLDILAGRVIPLRLGYVPVVNRGQRDVDGKKSIKEALEAERAFFENHPAYATKAQYCGTPFLARKLNLILMHHIRECLPDLKIKISQLLAKYRLELNELGEAMEDNENNWSNLLLTTITDFSNEYRTILEGYSENLSSSELAGGARISFVFHEIFANGIREVNPFDQIQDADIRTILYNSSGSSPALFVSGQSFEVLIRQQIKRLEEPAFQCVILVYDELMRILTQLEQRKMFKRFPALKERVHAAVVAFLRRLLDPTNKLVGDILKAESNYINTAHPDFLSGHRAMAIVNERLFGGMSMPAPQQPALPPGAKPGMPIPSAAATGQPGAPQPQPVMVPPTPQMPVYSAPQQENSGFFSSFFGSKNKPKSSGPGPLKLEQPPNQLRASGALSEREIMETEVIKLLLDSYFNIVKRTVSDMVPKAIMLHLVNYSKENMQRELLHELYKTKWDDVLKESEAVSSKRAECRRMIEVLTRAEEAVSNV